MECKIMFSWEINGFTAGVDLLLVIGMRRVSDNKNKAPCCENLSRYFVMLLYTE